MEDSFAQHTHKPFTPTMGVEEKSILIFKKIAAYLCVPIRNNRRTGLSVRRVNRVNHKSSN